MTGTAAYVLLAGMRGKACRIEKITQIDGGHRVYFVWNEETAAYVVGDTIWTVDGSFPATPEIEVNWWREQNETGTLVSHDLANEDEVKALDAPRVGGKIRRKTMDVMDGVLFVNHFQEELDPDDPVYTPIPLTEDDIGAVRYLTKPCYVEVDGKKRLKYGEGWYMVQEQLKPDGTSYSPKKYYRKYIWCTTFDELPELNSTSATMLDPGATFWGVDVNENIDGKVIEYCGESDVTIDTRLYQSPILIRGQKYICKKVEVLDWSDLENYPNGKSFSPKQYTWMWEPFNVGFTPVFQGAWNNSESMVVEGYVTNNTATLNLVAKHKDNTSTYSRIICSGLPKPSRCRYVELITGGLMNVNVPLQVNTNGELFISDAELPYGEISGKLEYKIM